MTSTVEPTDAGANIADGRCRPSCVDEAAQRPRVAVSVSSRGGWPPARGLAEPRDVLGRYRVSRRQKPPSRHASSLSKRRRMIAVSRRRTRSQTCLWARRRDAKRPSGEEQRGAARCSGRAVACLSLSESRRKQPRLSTRPSTVQRASRATTPGGAGYAVAFNERPPWSRRRRRFRARAVTELSMALPAGSFLGRCRGRPGACSGRCWPRVSGWVLRACSEPAV